MEESCKEYEFSSAHQMLVDANEIKGEIDPAHLKEWQESSVDAAMASLAIESIKGDRVYAELLAFCRSGIRKNDGRLKDSILAKYDLPARGGWIASGVDILQPGHPPANFFCFKPDWPRMARKKPKGFASSEKEENKPVKYEHPVEYPTEIFALRATLQVWRKIAERFGIAMPENITVLPSGEAVGFWAWALAHPALPLVITEGAKKAGAILCAGYLAIALPGISGGYRQPKDSNGNPDRSQARRLLAHLQPFAKGGRKVYFAFDRDTKAETIRAVERDIYRTAALLKAAGAGDIAVISWEDWKGADDLIYHEGVAAFEAAFENASAFEVWSARHYTLLSHKIDLRVNSRFFPDVEIPQETKIVAVKSPKGTGKTEWLVRQVEEVLREGKPVLVLTHRVQLQVALCNRFGLQTLDETRTSEIGKLLGYGLCVDSLRQNSAAHFNPAAFGDAIVIIDEAEQVYWHLLNANTEVKKHRSEILRNLEELFKCVSYGSGTIYLSDADLCDISLDYTLSLIGDNATTFIVENTWRPETGAKVYHYAHTTPEILVGEVVAEIRRGGRALVMVSGKKEKSRWGTRVLERYLKGLFPNKRILRIDSESIVDKHHPAYRCMGRLDELLSQYDIAIASPAIETGVSIDLRGHFTAVFGIFQGVHTADSVRQALARLREPVDRHIWIAKKGLSTIGDGSFVASRLLESEFHKGRAHMMSLLEASIGAVPTIDFEFQPASLNAWARRGAVINRQMARYREAVIEGIKNEGCRVITVDKEAPGEPISEDVKEVRGLLYDEYCTAVSAKVNPRDDRYDSLRNAREKTHDELLEERKGQMCRRYGEERVTPELVRLDDKGYFSALRLYYHLTIGREFLAAKEREAIVEQAESGAGAVFLPDFNRERVYAKVLLLEEMKARDLLEQGRTWRSDDHQLAAIADWCRAHPRATRALLGFRPYGSNIRIVQSVLKCFALSLPRTGKRVGPRGAQVYVYSSVDLNDGRDGILAAWYERDEEHRQAGESHAVVIARNIDKVLPTETMEGLVTTPDDRHAADYERDVRLVADWVSGALAQSREELMEVIEVVKGVVKAVPQFGRDVWRRLSSDIRMGIQRSITDQDTFPALGL